MGLGALNGVVMLRFNWKAKVYLAAIFGLIMTWSIAGCTLQQYPLPGFQSAPQYLDLDRLLADYADNPQAAGEKYQGKTFLFPSVKVESMMSRAMEPYRAEISTLYLQSSSARFLPRTIFGLDHVGPGFTVDIVGEVQGWVGGFFIIRNCTYVVVEGGDLPPPMAY
jgi:hypothetical protein